MVRVVGAPRLHPRYGFSVNYQTITPVGEGSIRKAADLLQAKLTAEGLFAPERKRSLPVTPARVGLITAASSAAAADFMKVLNERWGGVEVQLIDSLVQGDNAPAQLVRAIEHFNKLPELLEVLVITRGGGSGEDLAAFNDERVVRAVAASRIPTLVAIGHEVDISLAELAADLRASTPTAAAAALVPDRRQVLAGLKLQQKALAQGVAQTLRDARADSRQATQIIDQQLKYLLNSQSEKLAGLRRVLTAFNPDNVIKRGYAIVSKNGVYITRASAATTGDHLQLKLRGGTIQVDVESVDA